MSRVDYRSDHRRDDDIRPHVEQLWATEIERRLDRVLNDKSPGEPGPLSNGASSRSSQHSDNHVDMWAIASSVK